MPWTFDADELPGDDIYPWEMWERERPWCDDDTPGTARTTGAVPRCRPLPTAANPGRPAAAS